MTNSYLNIHEIKSAFSHYAKQVMKGKTFIIAIRNKPFAELRPLDSQPPAPLRFGVMKGKFTVPDDFDAPLVEFEKDFYGE